jgi:NADPH-dependent curcumin reductase CurA
MHSLAWLIARDSRAGYEPDCLRLTERPLPGLQSGQVLLKTIYLSLDPTSHNWLKLDPASSYLPLSVGDVMIGQTVSRVEASAAPEFQPGDLVSALSGWETYSIVPAERIYKVDAALPLWTHLTIFSHIGLAAATGMIGIGQVRAGQTVVVSAAAGATGSIAGQIAKAYGARVIGIAGGPDKCRRLRTEFGFDGAIDYKSEDLDEALTRHCPKGVDVFFDNVGGATLDAVLRHLAHNARIAVCGQIASYDRPNSGNGVRELMQLVFCRARMEGFIAGEDHQRNAEYHALLLRLYRDGQLKTRSHIVKGIGGAAAALKLLFAGLNEGKLIIEVASPP